MNVNLNTPSPRSQSPTVGLRNLKENGAPLPSNSSNQNNNDNNSHSIIDIALQSQLLDNQKGSNGPESRTLNDRDYHLDELDSTKGATSNDKLLKLLSVLPTFYLIVSNMFKYIESLADWYNDSLGDYLLEVYALDDSDEISSNETNNYDTSLQLYDDHILRNYIGFLTGLDIVNLFTTSKEKHKDYLTKKFDIPNQHYGLINTLPWLYRNYLKHYNGMKSHADKCKEPYLDFKLDSLNMQKLIGFNIENNYKSLKEMNEETNGGINLHHSHVMSRYFNIVEGKHEKYRIISGNVSRDLGVKMDDYDYVNFVIAIFEGLEEVPRNQVKACPFPTFENENISFDDKVRILIAVLRKFDSKHINNNVFKLFNDIKEEFKKNSSNNEIIF